MKKLIFSLSFSVLWVFVSYFIAIPWINDVASTLGAIVAYIFICGIAFIPAFAMAFVYSTLLLDKRIRKKEIVKLPSITILIAAYNEQDSILNTLHSIEAQEYSGDIEVIVCNDGSKDLTSKLVHNFINYIPYKKYEYKIIDILKNGGKSNALNQGLKLSKYDKVITIDADSTLHTGALDSIVRTLETCSENTVAVAGTILVNNYKKNLLTRIQQWDYLLGISSVKQAQSSYNGTLVAQGAFSIYKKDKLIEVGGWPETVGEDIVLTWNLLKKKYDVYHDTDAIVFTNVPENYKQYFYQRKRWSRGLVEAFKSSPELLIKPRKILPFIWYNLLFPYIDLSFSLVFVPSVIMALFFHYYLMAGSMTLMVLPLGLLLNVIIFMIQKRILKRNNIKIEKNAIGFIFFVLFYQIMLVPATISGYFSEILNLKKNWGTK